MVVAVKENLFSLFESRFPTDRKAPLLLLPSRQIVSYAEADQGSARYASVFRDHGIVAGGRVAVVVEKSVEAFLLYLGCLRGGFVYLPLNSAYQEAEVSYFLEDARPDVVIGQPSTSQWLGLLATRVGAQHVFFLDEKGEGSLREAARQADPCFPPVQRSGADVAAILYTSGTTGLSKGAMLSHHNLASNAISLHRIWGFRRDDILVHMLPLFHAHGLFIACHCVLLNGSAMHFHGKFDAGLAIADFSKATVFMGVPTFYSRLLADGRLTPEACRSMRLFISGSVPLLVDVHHNFERRSGHNILERYGMTETLILTSNRLEGERHVGSVGPALPETELRVVDDGGTQCAIGREGNVIVRGPSVFRGYWEKPERLAQDFTADGFFRTGDVGSLSETGHLTLVGRSKDLIITGGFNVYPKEIEMAIDGLPGIQESAVIGLPHPDFGEAVTAVVVGRSGAAPQTDTQIIAALRGRLASFKIPKRVYFIDELPRNSLGKVQKNILRQTYKSAFQIA
jgi:malonyl-CoA/methylmalonyl-CoA synthetase